MEDLRLPSAFYDTRALFDSSATTKPEYDRHAIEFIMTIFTFLALIVMASVTTYVNERFGELDASGQLQIQDGKLSGTYGQTVAGLSIGALITTAIALMAMGYNARVHQGSPMMRKKMLVYFLMLTLTVSLATASLNLHMVENYGDITTITFDPPIALLSGQNYKQRGPYGRAVLGMNSTTIGLATLSLGAVIYEHYRT
jgi:hypothetical protein